MVPLLDTKKRKMFSDATQTALEINTATHRLLNLLGIKFEDVVANDAKLSSLHSIIRNGKNELEKLESIVPKAEKIVKNTTNIVYNSEIKVSL